MSNDPVQRTITALREPDASLARVPNTIRQSMADIIEMQARRIDTFGLALRMIAAGCDNPEDVAAKAVAKSYYGAECASYPACSGGCGCGCTKEIEKSL